MSLDHLDPAILNDFLTESSELLERLEQDMVTLESTPDDSELLNSIFRSLHTIKGSGSFLNFDKLTRVAHAAEDALNVLRKGEAQVTKDTMNLLFEATGIISRQLDEVRAGRSPEGENQALIDSLLAIGAKRDAVASPPPAPAAPDKPAVAQLSLPASKLDLLPFMVDDLTHSIQEIEKLATGLAPGDDLGPTANNLHELTQELVRCVEFFEFEVLCREVRVLDRLAAAGAGLSAELLDQARPRLLALCMVIRQRAEALTQRQLIERNTALLIERLDQLAQGRALDASATLAEDASVEHVLVIDGVNPPAAQALEPAIATSDEADEARKPAANAGGDTPAKQAAGEQTIRVDVNRLESLLNLVGELVLQKNRIGALSRRIGANQADHELAEDILQAASDLDRVTSELQVGVMKTRLQPLNKLFSRYPRVVRDLAKTTEKQIELRIEGGDTEVDKSMIEVLADPMVHILRNSADHGIERPEVRRADGKPEAGTITISAWHEGSHVVVRISDDGKGIDPAAIRKKVLERGLATETELDSMPDSQVIRYIFAPGFSTAQQVSGLSGRGVGMDVVNTNITRLNGTVDVESTPGRGSAIIIKVPLTLAIMQAMMVVMDEAVYAVPLTNIIEIVHPTPQQVASVGGAPVLRLRDQVMPLVNFRRHVLGKDPSKAESFALIVGLGDKRAALQVDRLIGQQEIVIKPLDSMFERGNAVSGATIRDDGGVSLILDVGKIMQQSTNRGARIAA